MRYRLRAAATEVRTRWEALRGERNERTRRLTAAAEARALGYGGITVVAQVTGLSRATIQRGLRDLADPTQLPPAGQIRRAGGGRKPLTAHDPTLLPDLRRLVDPATRGDPESALKWTSKSLTHLTAALRDQGHRVSATTVMQLLHREGYSLQAPRKTLEGLARHPDRDAQFQYIADQATTRQAAHLPVISVDSKKKELVGNFKTGGQEWQPAGQPERVLVYDFLHLGIGKATPYGIYDLARNEGWVTVGSDHDTAQFAVATLRRWWQERGCHQYPEARELYIVADGGGSNGSRVRLWKTELQRFATDTGLTIQVSHFPPGTSKWNAIEHRLFSVISRTWRGRPLTTYETVVQCIAHTTTETGLTVHAEWDPTPYPTGLRVSDADLAAVHLTPATFHGEWNYRIDP
jgi:transposase